MAKSKPGANGEPYTAQHVLTMIRAALRKTWTATTKRDFIIASRKPYVGVGSYKWGLTCRNPDCRKLMGLSQRERITLTSGRLSKKAQLVYNIDHINGITPMKDITDLGKYSYDLFYGSLRVLCYQCHREHTKSQSKRRKSERTS